MSLDMAGQKCLMEKIEEEFANQVNVNYTENALCNFV